MRWMAAAVAAIGILLTPAVAKQKPGKGHGKGHQKDTVVVFAPADRGVITNYYRSKGSLPPGLEKQLRRNGRLPPGLEKKFAPFPAEIESRLPPCPPDVRRGIVGGVAVMYNSRTGLVLDAMVLAGR